MLLRGFKTCRLMAAAACRMLVGVEVGARGRCLLTPFSLTLSFILRDSLVELGVRTQACLSLEIPFCMLFISLDQT